MTIQEIALTDCLVRLVAKLEAIEANTQFQSVWVQYFTHGGKYTGPNWRDELAEARQLLKHNEDQETQG